uniref:SCP domain-containing protein n=1 Tax=Mesocestoides corti TaxID=53468 RepID=A0A5K3FM92_MESCO
MISHVLAQAPTQAERDAILKVHHSVRENVQPPASNMEMMEYSLSLEKLAVDWVKLCRFEYPNLNIYPKYRGVGQLLTLIGGSKPELVDAAHTWYDQGKTYHFANNTCEDYCGGYLQMVWAKSVRLGCAMMRCDHVKPSWSKPVYIVTCLYRPGALRVNDGEIIGIGSDHDQRVARFQGDRDHAKYAVQGHVQFASEERDSADVQDILLWLPLRQRRNRQLRVDEERWNIDT